MRGTRGCRSGRRATRATTIAGTRTARTLQAINARRVAQQRLVDQAGRRNGADGRDGRRCSASFGTMADARPGKALTVQACGPWSQRYQPRPSAAAGAMCICRPNVRRLKWAGGRSTMPTAASRSAGDASMRIQNTTLIARWSPGRTGVRLLSRLRRYQAPNRCASLTPPARASPLGRCCTCAARATTPAWRAAFLTRRPLSPPLLLPSLTVPDSNPTVDLAAAAPPQAVAAAVTCRPTPSASHSFDPSPTAPRRRPRASDDTLPEHPTVASSPRPAAYLPPRPSP